MTFIDLTNNCIIAGVTIETAPYSASGHAGNIRPVRVFASVALKEEVPMKKLLVLFAALSLAACAGFTVRLSLSGAEEVPPLSVPGSGSGSFTIGEDGSVAGSVTTTGVEGTMAHIHLGAR
ncbi:MAG: CHRD domain-containing protein, partial [Terriglobales bacterium]